MLLKIKNPDISNQPQTFVTAAVTAADATLTVQDIAGFAIAQFLLIGTPWTEKCEIIKTHASTAPTGSTITLDASYKPAYAHPSNAPVTKILYNTVRIERATSESGSYSDIAGAGGTAILPDTEYTVYNDTAGLTTSWYRSRFYDGTNVSSYSSVIQATGVKTNSFGKALEKCKILFSDPDYKRVSYDEWLLFWNDWQRDVSEFKNWSWQQATDQSNTTTSGVMSLSWPSDIKAEEKKYIRSVKINTQEWLEYLDLPDFDEQMQGLGYSTLSVAASTGDTELTLYDVSNFAESGSVIIDGDTIAYTGVDEDNLQLTGVTGITAAGHDADDGVWQSTEVDTPTHWTVWGGTLKILRAPDTTGDRIYLYYWKGITESTQENSVTIIPFYRTALPYMLWRAHQSDGDEQRASQYRLEYEQGLQLQSNRDRGGNRKSFTLVEDNAPELLDFDKGYLKIARQ